MPPKRKRPRDDDDDGQDHSNQDNKRYAYLKPRVRRVSQQTIKEKWTPLSEQAQRKVHDMFLAAERPVIVRQHNERKRIEAQSAVQAVVKNLAKRLPRMLFPPGTTAADFEYEAALGVLRSLVARKATATDESHFLKALIKKEEALLADERKALQEMEKNAKNAKAQKEKQANSEEHRILRQLDDLAPSKDQQPTGFTLSGDVGERATLSDLGEDPEVIGLLKQLNGHLQSMQNNTAPLAGLQDAIILAQNALSLFRMEED